MTTGKCLDCGEFNELYRDFRTPPLELDNCLCYECFANGIQEALDELKNEIETLRGEFEKATKIHTTKG